MLSNPTSHNDEETATVAAWGGVFALSLGAFALIASEFMPVSLLTPIASDLNISEGQAGQAISVSGAFAIITSLLITRVAGGLDRKTLLLLLTGLMAISGAVVAFAPNYAIFMVGRAMIGVAIGGFWSMSAATAMRLVPATDVARALAILNGGNALATVIAAPLGSFLGGIIGWRGAFFVVVPVALVVLVWQWICLPSMRPRHTAAGGNVLKLLVRREVAIGMVAAGLFFMGQFVLFTYLRPFMETITHVDVSVLSIILFVMGLSGFVGTMLIGRFLQNGLYRTLTLIPLAMAAIAVTLIGAGGSPTAVAVLLAAWGLLATSAPVGWWTWIARTMPDDAEAGGGLMVAVVQLSIALGAVGGGVLFDRDGYQATFGSSALILLAAAFFAVLAARALQSGRTAVEEGAC